MYPCPLPWTDRAGHLGSSSLQGSPSHVHGQGDPQPLAIQASGSVLVCKRRHVFDHQLALRSQEWLPLHPLPCALGKGGDPLQEQKPLGRDRGWTPGLPLPSPWQLPLGQQPSLNVQPKSNFITNSGSQARETHTDAASCGWRPSGSVPDRHPPTPAQSCGSPHPQADRRPSRDIARCRGPGCPGAAPGPFAAGGRGAPAARQRPPQGSHSLGEPGSQPFLTTLTSALWKQLLLEGLSISLFLQEINTPHKVITKITVPRNHKNRKGI